MIVDFAEMQQMLSNQTELLSRLVENVSKLEQPKTDGYMTINNAAEYLDISPSTLRRYLKEIPHSQRDRVIIIKKTDIDKWVSRFKVNV